MEPRRDYRVAVMIRGTGMFWRELFGTQCQPDFCSRPILYGIWNVLVGISYLVKDYSPWPTDAEIHCSKTSPLMAISFEKSSQGDASSPTCSSKFHPLVRMYDVRRSYVLRTVRSGSHTLSDDRRGD
jgi:hypothetical protein